MQVISPLMPWRQDPLLVPTSAVYMRRGTGSALIRVMALRLFGANPLPEPVLTYN